MPIQSSTGFDSDQILGNQKQWAFFKSFLPIDSHGQFKTIPLPCTTLMPLIFKKLKKKKSEFTHILSTW